MHLQIDPNNMGDVKQLIEFAAHLKTIHGVTDEESIIKPD
jgi:hypothetical protein